MRALSLWQPWASLICPGPDLAPVKTIETRSWSTRYRGPLLICSAKTTAGFDLLPGDCEGTIEAGWRYGYIGDFQASYCYRTSDEGRRGATMLVNTTAGVPYDLAIETPLGFALGLANLVDCVPVLEASVARRRNNLDLPYPRIESDIGGADYPDGWLDLYHPTHGNQIDPECDISIPEQASYGDFTPGRFGWLLDDIRSLPEPAPVKGMQGLWTPDDDLIAAVTEHLAVQA